MRTVFPVLLTTFASILSACGGGQSAAPTYTVGGTLTGLSGSGLTLQLNGGPKLMLAANGAFQFPSPLAPAGSYVLTIAAQPSKPEQTCTATNVSGMVQTANVTDISVTCTTNTYTIGGTVSGLAGNGLILELNGGDDLPVGSNGLFSFAGAALSGSNYAVTVKAQPSGVSQTCTPTNAIGTVGAAAIANVSVTCTTNSFSVGGTVSGLSGSGLVVQVNGGQNLPVSANGSFKFPTQLVSGANYTVTIAMQPSVRHEICTIANAKGTMVAANVSSVALTCETVAGFVYNIEPGDNLAVYGIDPTSGAPISFGPPNSLGGTPTNLVAAPNGKSLAVLSSVSNTVSVYAVNANQGALTPVGSPLTTGKQPSVLLYAPSGAYLFVSNFGDGTVATYSVDPSSGALSAIGNPLSFPGGSRNFLAVTPNGGFLYVLSEPMATDDLPPPITVTAYAINPATGALSAGPSIQPAIYSQVIAVDPLGRFLYLDSESGNGLDATASVLSYAIDPSTGALTPLGTGATVGSVANGNSNGIQVLAEPSGKYLYVLSNFNFAMADDNISALAIDPATGLTSLLGLPVAIGNDPGIAVCDPSGKFIYTANIGANSFLPSGPPWTGVSSFAIKGNGASAGQLSASGQGNQYAASTLSSYVGIAIVE